MGASPCSLCCQTASDPKQSDFDPNKESFPSDHVGTDTDDIQKFEANGTNSANMRRGGERQKGKANRIGNRAGNDGETKGEEHLAAHRRPRNKGTETKKLIRQAMKQDRVCAMLEEVEIDTILETMEYFEFAANDQVLKQGDVGTTFFVTHEGTMEVSVNGRVVNTMNRGRAFGGLALLYNCPRTSSVISTTKSAAWGANGGTFHMVLQENAKKSYAENRKFLDSIRLFDGLAVKQKDRVGEAFFVEVFEEGARVVTEGEAATAMYFVKVGNLRVVTGAKIASNGKVVGGKDIAKINSGECFGERALLYNENRGSTVVAETRCEILVISGEQLREVLGIDLKQTLEQNFILTGVKKSPILSQFTTSQQTSIVKGVTLQDFKAFAAVPARLRFGLVMDGELKGAKNGVPITLARGSCWEMDNLIYEASSEKSNHRKTARADMALASLEKGADDSAELANLAAGPNGVRVGLLTDDVLAKILNELGLAKLGDASQAADYTRKMILCRKVQVFRHLAPEALDKLVNAFVLEKYKKSQYVFKQGEKGDKFFVIASGEVGIYINDNFIRTMPRNQFFGERALLFDEPRTATVQVSTNEAELWSIEKVMFKSIITSKMQQELTSKIRLQDTSVTMKDLKHVKVVGAGAAGVVRLVEHKRTGTRYALKRVYKTDGKIPEEVNRECALLAENDHPFIMQLVKTFDTASSVYMLTELITGGELHAAIRTVPTVLSRAQCQFYGGSIILVLEELAERNIVYRDMKPENVMLDQQGYLKLIDFGIAKKLEEGKTRTYTMIGTPHYMAPEVMRGHGYGTEVDIWSFGIMCFEFVCGYLPFADDLDDPTEVCTAVLKDSLAFPSGYKDLIGRQMLDTKTGVLVRQPKKRLGAGISGYEDIKNHEYFKAGHSTSTLFTKILGRELDPPVVPPKEIYSPPEDLADVKLDDAHELG